MFYDVFQISYRWDSNIASIVYLLSMTLESTLCSYNLCSVERTASKRVACRDRSLAIRPLIKQSVRPIVLA